MWLLAPGGDLGVEKCTRFRRGFSETTLNADTGKPHFGPFPRIYNPFHGSVYQLFLVNLISQDCSDNVFVKPWRKSHFKLGFHGPNRI